MFLKKSSHAREVKIKINGQGHIKYGHSVHSQTIFKIGVLKNFATFTKKQICWSLFKKGFQHKYFHENIIKFLRAVFLYRTLVIASPWL